MDEEKKEQDLNEESIVEEVETEQEEYEIEDSLEEMEKELDGEVVEEKKKTSFWKDLSHQAVSKIFFLFAGIGFFFPFFTVACQGQNTGLFMKGFDLVLGTKIPTQIGEIPVASNPLMIAIFAVIVVSLILSVFLKGMARNIAGAICSIIVTVSMAVFAIVLPQAIIDTIKNVVVSFKLGDPSQLPDLSGITPVLEPGFYFVIALMVVNFIYYIVQIAMDSKRRAKEVMEFEGIAFEEEFEEPEWEETAEQEPETEDQDVKDKDKE